MRRFQCALLAAVAAIGFASVASAADMPTKAPMYTKAPVMVPLYNWTGFYVGLNAGYSWGRQDNSAVSAAGVTVLSNSDHLNGFIGGGQIGYNWQVNQWVFGLEADFQGSGQKADGTFLIVPVGVFFNAPPPSTSIAYTDKLDWFGTVRGRIGYAMGANGNWLPYLTGGWAYGHGEISGTTTIGAVATSFSGSQITVAGRWAVVWNGHSKIIGVRNSNISTSILATGPRRRTPPPDGVSSAAT
jgi:outer membrane immunogenic protein